MRFFVKGAHLEKNTHYTISHKLKTKPKLEGYEGIHTATSGKEAIARIKVLKYDLILLDIRMPEMNGIEILKEIRKYDEKVPVAMMSAYEDMDLAQEALRLGAYDFIKKPIDHDYLKASVLSKLIPGDK
ncbi:response regulator [Candidatus Desantisbacteria bacterium CG_4_10_14_0_8_um_filter_39_17]|uniref:Response regulator n=1 Tax=Candidatus Desantisbacteria bacterium CG_4_10_14_0_8_um_filter_39_17 TaxID=1974542 RepID=A0A2H9PD18_9BACT|nr:MAG: response regulator [Candidatus Desantisbacteria bacterium CG_4_10_14_0_8_um_filter_39_17]